MSCAQWPHQPRLRIPTLYRKTVNSGLRTTRYSFLRLRAFVCAVADNACASAGSTSCARAVSALVRSLIDLSSVALAVWTTRRSAKMKKTLRIIWCQRVAAISDRRKLYQTALEVLAAANASSLVGV